MPHKKEYSNDNTENKETEDDEQFPSIKIKTMNNILMIILRLNTKKNGLMIILKPKRYHTKRNILMIILKTKRRETMNNFHKNKDYGKKSHDNTDTEPKENKDTKDILSLYLSSIKFHSKVIHFVIHYISKYGDNMTKKKEKDKNIETLDKCKVDA